MTSCSSETRLHLQESQNRKENEKAEERKLREQRFDEEKEQKRKKLEIMEHVPTVGT